MSGSSDRNAHGERSTLRASWQGFCTNQHVRAECTALVYLALAIAAFAVGLRIAPVACAAMAVLFASTDIYGWLREH